LLKNSHHINLSLFYNEINTSIYNDYKFIQLMNLIIKKESINKYIYALYGDSDALGDSLLVPTFHTLYLGCRQNNVIISDIKHLWLLDIYTNNKYYYLLNIDDSNNNEALSKYQITTIKHLEEIQ